MIALGGFNNAQPIRIQRGSTNISAVYLGSERIWEEFTYNSDDAFTVIIDTFLSTRINYDNTITFTLPVEENTSQRNRYIDWGDGNITIENGLLPYHNYNFNASDKRFFTIKMYGGTTRGFRSEIESISIPGGSRNSFIQSWRECLISVTNWGKRIGWTSFSHAFYRCKNNFTIPNNIPTIAGGFSTNVTDLTAMFVQADSFNQNIGDWDTSNVTNMKLLFSQASSFNQNIGGWNTSNVTDMSYMFVLNTYFNQNIGNWDTSNVTDMTYMFAVAYSFNQNIGGWNTSNVTNMSYMFSGTKYFNQNIGNWDTSNVTNMSNMFAHSSFNQNIGNWDTSNVTNMQGMFTFNDTFNQNIGGWNTSNVTDMSYMFYSNVNGFTVPFNQDIGSWNTSKVTDMTSMFTGSAFNRNIGSWNILSCKKLSLRPTGMSVENSARTIIGWANRVRNAGNIPTNAEFSFTSYNNINYGGTPYNNAIDAFTYLTTSQPNGPGWVHNGQILNIN